jgi:hypothetical protein
MEHTDCSPALWHYTLQINYWLNQQRSYGMFLAFSRRRYVITVYDFTIWKNGKPVAAWIGSECDAFNAMLYFAGREEREAGVP